MVGLLDRHLKNVLDTEKFRELARTPAAGNHTPREPRALPAMARRLNAEEIAELASYYRAGVKVAEIAQRYGIHRATVTEIINQHGIDRRKRGLDKDEVPKVIAEYQGGESLKTLGERYGVHPSTINNTLTRHGITLRPRNGWSYASSS